MGGHNLPWELSGQAWRIPDPGDAGAVDLKQSGICVMTTGASGETRTVAAPQEIGQRLTLVLGTDGGGDAVVTFSAGINVTGNTQATFANAGEFLDLTGVEVGTALVWRTRAPLPHTDAPTLA